MTIKSDIAQSCLTRQFRQDQRGAIVIIFALVLPVILLATGGAIDYAMLVNQKSRLQSMTDAAAIAGAKELSLSNASSGQVTAIVSALVDRQVEAMADAASGAKPVVSAQVTQSPLKVSVSVTQPASSPFSKSVGLKVGSLTVKAEALVVGKPNICVLALHPSANGAISLEQDALVTGSNCAVYSNSTHSIGIKAKSSSRLTATTICSAGGVQDSESLMDPPPYLDCPQFDDPLAGRVAPTVGTCANSGPTEITYSQNLAPGTYCGLTVRNGATAFLDEGVYVIKDGPLIVTEGGSIVGKGVGFYLTGKMAALAFDGSSTISLEAPLSGDMAGLLIYADRNTAKGLQHKIYSEDAQVMVGTIYVPTGEVRVDGSANVGTKSAYTAIVAETLRLYGGPHIKLNTNYDQTDVPVPDGIKGAGQPIALSQ